MSESKVAIVTGANKGLGYAITQKLCEKYKGKVYLTSRDEVKGRNACEQLMKLGLNPTFYQLDITNNESVKKFVTHIHDNNEEVEILINNAGVLFLKDAPESKLVQAQQTISVNFTSLVFLTEAILPFMKSGGKIVNISSSSGHLSRIPSEDLRKKFSSKKLTLDELKCLVSSYVEDVTADREIRKGWGASPYVVSKVAVNAYTFILHRKLASQGITVNCVHPGYVQSDMTHGAGNIAPLLAANVPVQLALAPREIGQFIWHNGSAVPWGGKDPRVYIDGRHV
ncbi:carbonyl reductase [NADPH] 3-like isoform X2 [Trichoplusia ni]|nr:carbonyl reductase [NADPH] 3-like isoform X2 [Trichoplusia ni]XP_026733826.1 carbonyl reductase [NADPH] 3-like isoform X2 [Trichoplusia ni]